MSICPWTNRPFYAEATSRVSIYWLVSPNHLSTWLLSIVSLYFSKNLFLSAGWYTQHVFPNTIYFSVLRHRKTWQASRDRHKKPTMLQIFVCVLRWYFYEFQNSQTTPFNSYLCLLSLLQEICKRINDSVPN